MANHLQLADHFKVEELQSRYRNCTDALERAHWHIIWLKSQGHSTPEIAAVVAYSENWIRTLIHRYNEHGEAALRDRRHEHRGATPMLSEQQQAELDRLLETQKAPDGGPWTGPKIARWIETRTGREKVHDQRGWDYLMRLGFSAQTPRPRHAEANAAEQVAFKK